jgi:hypothetical protein
LQRSTWQGEPHHSSRLFTSSHTHTHTHTHIHTHTHTHTHAPIHALLLRPSSSCICECACSLRCQSERAASASQASALRLSAESLTQKAGLPPRTPIGEVVEALGSQLDEAKGAANRARIERQALEQQAARGNSRPSASGLWLHEAFTFRRQRQPGALSSGAGGDAGNEQPPLPSLIKALATVAGSYLSSVWVCPSRSDASRILQDIQGGSAVGGKGPAKLRIWPLDAIAAPADKAATFDAAIRDLGARRAWNPLSLLEPLRAEYAAALSKSFGHSLIVLDHQAASHASTVHQLPCVCVDGTLSCPGAVSGGWTGVGGRGALSPNELLLKVKLDLGEAAAREAAAFGEVERLSEMLKEAEELHERLALCREEGELLGKREEEARRVVSELEAELRDARTRLGQVREEVEAAEGDVRRIEGQQAAQTGRGKGKQGGKDEELRRGGAREALQEELRKLEGDQREEAEATEQVEKAAGRLEELLCLLGVEETEGGGGEEEDEGKEGPEAGVALRRLGGELAAEMEALGARKGELEALLAKARREEGESEK